jgi:4-hydroxy-tetrahydrodipicolinate synthase
MVLDRSQLKGTFTALITVINEDRSVNVEDTLKITRFSLENGCDVVASSTTGQSATLSPEKRDLDRMIIELAHSYGRLSVVGASSYDTANAVQLTECVFEDGGDATLQVKPPYNRPNPRGQYEHFTAIARKRPELPMIMYDVPTRTGGPKGGDIIIPEVRAEVSANNPNAFAIKDATSDENVWRKTNELMKERKLDFILGIGNDGDTYRMMKDFGSKFVICVDSNPFPHIRSEMTQKMLEGKYEEGEKLHEMIKLFTKNEGATVKTRLGMYEIDDPCANPFGANAFLYVIGAISSPELRLPLKMTPEFVRYMANVVAWPMNYSEYREKLFGPYSGDVFKLPLYKIEKNIKRFL